MPAVFASYPNALLLVKLMKKPCGWFDFLQCRFVLRCFIVGPLHQPRRVQ